MIEWIFKNVKVKTETLQSMIAVCDMDKDGYISVEEFVEILKGLVKR